jgi:hypothetical protein
MSHAARFLAIALVISSFTPARAQKPSWEYPTAKIRGWHAQAIEVALREFRKHQGGKNEYGEPGYGDLRHYAVWVSQSPPDLLPLKYARDECVRVSFVPDSAPNDRYEVGGRTSYGIEVSYDISKRTLKIVKTSFAR